MPAIAPEPPVLWHGDVIEIGAFIHGVLQDGLVVIIYVMGRVSFIHTPHNKGSGDRNH